MNISKINRLLVPAAIMLSYGLVTSHQVEASEDACGRPLTQSSTEVNFDLKPFTSDLPEGLKVFVTYENDEGEKIRSELNGLSGGYEIRRDTQFHFQVFSSKGNEGMLKEWTRDVSPIVTSVGTLKEGETTVAVNTEPNASVEYRYSGERGTSRRSLNTDEEGTFRGEFGSKGSGRIIIQKKDIGIEKRQSVSVSYTDIDASPPVIDQSMYQKDNENDEGSGIRVDIDDPINMIHLEYLDKDKKIIRSNTLDYRNNYNLRTDPYLIYNGTGRTYKEDGIKYIRLRGVNENGCESSDWKEITLKDVTGPIVEMDPTLKGDMYISGKSEPGARIVWSQNQSIGTAKVGSDGRYKVVLPKKVSLNPPVLKFYDGLNNESEANISVLSKIDRFMVTDDHYMIYALTDSSRLNYGRHEIELNGKRTKLVVSGSGISFDAGEDDSVRFPKSPFKIKYHALNVDGTTKYSLEQVVSEEKVEGLKNIRYDLEKQVLYGESNLFYRPALVNERTGWSSSIYTHEKQVRLPLSDMKKLSKVGDTISLYSRAGDKSATLQKITIKQTKKLKAPMVREVNDFSNYVEGSTLPSMTVQVKMNDKNYTGQSSSKGLFKIKVASPVAGKEVRVVATDHLNQSTPVTISKVLRVFSYFSVSGVTTKSIGVKGKGSAGAEVSVFVGKKLMGQTLIDKKENFSIRLPQLKKGTALKIDVKKKGYQTRSLTVKVY